MHGDSIVVIEYHARVAGDTLSPCSTFVEDRQTLYGVSAYPTVEFDGVEEVVGAVGDLVSTFLNILESRFSNRSSLRFLLFDADFIDASSVSFDIQITANADVSARLFIVLTEDSVVLDDSVYNFVARQVYPDDNGMSFSVAAEDTFGANGSIALSWQPHGDVRAVVFVQNISSGEIYQAREVVLGKPAAVQFDFDVSVMPDTVQTGVPGQPSVFTFLISNTGSNNDDYQIHASEVATVPGWSWMLCSGGLCKVPDHGHIYDTLSIVSQAVDSFTVDIIPDSTAGTQEINVLINSEGDSTLVESFTVYTNLP
jgi:hypothetical protein